MQVLLLRLPKTQAIDVLDTKATGDGVTADSLQVITEFDVAKFNDGVGQLIGFGEKLNDRVLEQQLCALQVVVRAKMAAGNLSKFWLSATTLEEKSISEKACSLATAFTAVFTVFSAFATPPAKVDHFLANGHFSQPQEVDQGRGPPRVPSVPRGFGRPA